MSYRDKFLQIFVLSFFGGVFLRSFLNVDLIFCVTIFVFSIFSALLSFLLVKFFNFEKTFLKRIVLFSIFLLGFGLGIFRLDYAFYKATPDYLSSFVNKKIVLEGVISKEVDKRQEHDVLVVDVKNILNFEQEKQIKEKVLVFVSKFPSLNYGDFLQIEGEVELPQNFQNENGKEFDYKSYLAKDDIYYQIFYPKIKVLRIGEGNYFISFILKIKNFFVSSIEKMIPEPESGLLSGLLLGSKKALSDEWVERFRASGLVHMVVLSGYNITIVADSIIKFFSFLPVFVSNIFAVFGILAFALMTGATPTTVRASIMALVAIFSRHTGRTYLAGRALIFAGFVMVLNNPKILAFDFSFQLSFLATVAIIFLSPKIKDHLNFVTEKFGLREIVASTLATQIFVAPLLLFRSGQLSILSLPANILVLGFVPSTMFFGFLTGIFGFISEIIAWPFSLITYVLLKYEMFIANFFSSLPLAQITISSFSKTALAVSYLILLYLTFFFRKREKAKIG
jgi:competence protein ComEC